MMHHPTTTHNQMVSVCVAQAVGVESPREEAHAAARALLGQALQPAAQQQEQEQEPGCVSGALGRFRVGGEKG